MNKQTTTEAIILKRRNYSEADRLLTLFTKDHGKLDVRAKGVRKPTSRKRGHVELFTHISAHLVTGKWLPILTEAQTITPFQRPSELETVSESTHVNHIYHAYHLAEVVDRLMPEHDPHPDIFDMLTKALMYVCSPQADLNQLHRGFKFRILQKLGYWPHGKQAPSDIDGYLNSILERPLKTTAFLSQPAYLVT